MNARPSPAAVQDAQPAHRNVYCALAAAQAEFSAPKKDAVNPAFRSKYADLASVVEAVAPALSRHGMIFTHFNDARDIGRGVEACKVTALIHGESDTRIECAVPMIVAKNDMQGWKSADTYAKRIGLESVTGVAPEDDDGNDAARNAPKARARDEGPTRATVPNERFETDDGRINARKAIPYPENATPAEMARIAADGIVAEFDAVKRAEGHEGVWTRNEGLIKRLQASYPAEFGDVVAAAERAGKRLGLYPENVPEPSQMAMVP